MDSRVLIPLFVLGLFAASASPIEVPGREGSISGAMREGAHAGIAEVPWVSSAELDGQAEEWIPWTGLPLRSTAEPLQGADDALSGVGATGPLGATALETGSGTGFGGEQPWRIRANALATDTPATSLQFWRGAVNSYRFGFGLSRNVLGPWSIDLRMNTRSSPGRNWEYRQQVNDLYGPRGNPAGLPFQGRGPGQDDTRWESVVSRSLEGGRLDLGWNWVDERRGVPDPLSSWDSLLPRSDAQFATSSLFGRLQLERGTWNIEAGTRQESRSWSLPAWTDTGSSAMAAGDGSIQSINTTLGIGPVGKRIRLEGLYQALDEQALVPRATGNFEGAVVESRMRGGISSVATLGPIELEAGGGLDRLEQADAKTSTEIDGRASVRWTSGPAALSTSWNRSVVLPGFDESLRPDGFRPRLDATGLEPETRDRFEIRTGLDLGWVGLDLGAAGLSIASALRPSIIPSDEAPSRATRDDALRLTNRPESVLGYSLQAGLHARWNTLAAATKFGYGWTGIPGESFGGKADRSESRLRTRSSLRWSAELLPGRFRATSTISLATASAVLMYVPDASDAVLVDLDPSWNLDLENRCEIRTFEIFWRIENLGHRRQQALPGWTPLGIRSGWGVVWNFGG